MIRISFVAALAVCATACGFIAQRGPDSQATGFPATCVVERVIDGDTIVCADATRVRLLQINTPELDECGGEWAKAALNNLFLRPGTVARLEFDRVRGDRYGRQLAAPIVTGTDGTEYNISIVMVFVGLAKAAYYGDNEKYLDWANAAETWAMNAGWNMWAPGGPYNGGTYCGPG